MSSALSVELRERVVHAVEAGAFRHQAAERFGVSLASASRWCGRFAREGHVAPKPMGGDQRSHEIEAQAGLILSLYEAQPGIYLHELRAALAKYGICVAQNSLSRFFERHGISRKDVWPAPSARWSMKASLSGLHKRIRHVGAVAAAKMESRTPPRAS